MEEIVFDESPVAAAPRSVCRHFAKGRCREGANCRFVHSASPLASGGVQVAGSPPVEEGKKKRDGKRGKKKEAGGYDHAVSPDDEDLLDTVAVEAAFPGEKKTKKKPGEKERGTGSPKAANTPATASSVQVAKPQNAEAAKPKAAESSPSNKVIVTKKYADAAASPPLKKEDSPARGGMREESPGKSSPKVCYRFQQGQCTFGARCKYAHPGSGGSPKGSPKESPKAGKQPRVLKQNTAAALESALFGWRSFICSSLGKLQDKSVVRLVYYGVTDVRVNLLVREVERRSLHCYVSGDCEISVQKKPFVPEAEERNNPIVKYLSRVGSCISRVGLMDHLALTSATFDSDMASAQIEQHAIGKCRVVQLARCCVALPEASVLRFDCNAASSGEVETVAIKNQPGPLRVSIRRALTDFAQSDRFSMIVDPNLDNLERKMVHEMVRSLGLKSKSDGAEHERVMTVWKPASFVKPGAAKQRLMATAVVKAKAPSAHGPPPTRDNSNSTIGLASVAAVVVVDSPVAVVASVLWVCAVCEAENAKQDTACCVCMIERESEAEGEEAE
jgi:hypothetical protein